MTAPAAAPPPPSPPPPPPPPPLAPLLRRRDDQVLRGVCAAVGRSTGTDPVLWRVVVAVLVLFGGTGVVLYAAGWLLIPEQGADTSIAERLVRARSSGRTLSTAAVVALVFAAAVLVLSLGLDGPDGAVPLLAVGVLAYVVLRGRAPALRLATPEESRAAAAPPAAAPGTVEPWTTEPWAAPAWTAPVPEQGWSLPPRRPRSPLGLLTLSGALLLTGVLLGLHAAGVDGITVGRVLAADLVAVGLGLLLGAWPGGVRVGRARTGQARTGRARWGRARWLALPAVLLATALAVTASARVPVALSLGERTWRPGVTGQAAPAAYRLGVGEAVLDLSRLDPVADPDLRAELGAGHLVLQLAPGLHLELTAEVAAGEVLLPAETSDGGTRLIDGTRLRVVRTYGPADAPLVRLDAVVGVGQLEVRRDV